MCDSCGVQDKSSQSQQRGITLDLGFSAFTMTIPPQLLEAAGDQYDCLQFTLVDCPGHASLIKTIIGGAQIIDMIVLVIDINKGIQTQTAECIVIGEITTEKIIIVLNKVDMIPAEDREERIEKMKSKLRKVFSSTKFADPVFVLTSAAVGGEKVASVVAFSSGKDKDASLTSVAQATEDSINGGGSVGAGKAKKGSKAAAAALTRVETRGVDALIDVIRSSITMPRRNYQGPFYFAIDHCFPIKGQGTVVTGTVLSGSVKVQEDYSRGVSVPEPE
jgi:selenocysteine-specific elongation factor